MKKVLVILTIGCFSFGLSALNVSLEGGGSSGDPKAPIVINVENNCNRKENVTTTVFERCGDGTVRLADDSFSIIWGSASIPSGNRHQIILYPHWEDNAPHEFEITVTDSRGKKWSLPFTIIPPLRKTVELTKIEKDALGFMKAKVAVAESSSLRDSRIP
ncbi:MAG: hypothetical protein LBF54_03325 [Holosporaceae bacterium]|jgi:hypothetical protein|nr:hypothetical protein [Holosporaceae bacterium]